MASKVRTAGVDEARTNLPEILRAANNEGAVTIVTKRGKPYAAVVPVWQALREASSLSTLRGSTTAANDDPGRSLAPAGRATMKDVSALPPGLIVEP